MPFAIPRPACLLSGALLLAWGSANAAVFTDEGPYDTAGSRSGEGGGVVATGGERLSGSRLHLYHGGWPGSAKVHDDRPVAARSRADCGGSARIAAVSWPASGIPNGSNHAIA